MEHMKARTIELTRGVDENARKSAEGKVDRYRIRSECKQKLLLPGRLRPTNPACQSAFAESRESNPKNAFVVKSP
jgi:hypothetical protein